MKLSDLKDKKFKDQNKNDFADNWKNEIVRIIGDDRGSPDGESYIMSSYFEVDNIDTGPEIISNIEIDDTGPKKDLLTIINIC